MSIDPSDIPTDTFLRSQWIQTELRRRATNLRRLALENDLSQTAVYYALRAPSLPGEKLIAKALGTTPRVLFPERYTADGKRLHSVREDRARKSKAA